MIRRSLTAAALTAAGLLGAETATAGSLNFGYNNGNFGIRFGINANQFASRGTFFNGGFGNGFGGVRTFTFATGGGYRFHSGFHSGFNRLAGFQPFAGRFHRFGQFGFPQFSYGYGYPFGVGRYGTYPLFAGYSGAPLYPLNRLFYGVGAYGIGLPDGVELPAWGPRYGLPLGPFAGEGPLEPAGPEDIQDFAEMPEPPFPYFEGVPEVTVPHIQVPAISVPAINLPGFSPGVAPLGNRPPPAIPVPGFTP